MRAVLYRRYGGPEVVEIGEVADPHPGAGEIRIKVKAASVNPIDWKMQSGMLAGGKVLDHVEVGGRDASGYVDELGDGVTGVAVGDEVFGLASRAQAELAVLTAWAVKPPAIDWAVAAAAGVAGETAVRGLNLLGIDSGKSVFIAGGAGGVGSVAVQVAVARGALVVASGGEQSDDYLTEIGARPVRYGPGVVDRAREVLGAERFDGVFDVTGMTDVDDLISLAPEPSRVVSIANFSAQDRGITVTASGGGDRETALHEVADLLVSNRLVIKVQTFPFDRAAEAFQLSRDGHVRGKLVLVP